MENNQKKHEEKSQESKRQKVDDDSDHLNLSLSPPHSTPPSSLSSSISHSHPSSSMQIQTQFSQTFSQTPYDQSSPIQHTWFHSPPLQLLHQPQPSLGPSPGPSLASSSRSVRTRRNQSHVPNKVKSETIPVPFPWATDRRAIVHSLNYLRENHILNITGKVKCKTCDSNNNNNNDNGYDTVSFDLDRKFAEVSTYIAMNKCTMHDRAPDVWENPILPRCRKCGNSVRPVVSERKRDINWLFLLLGQMLGCLTLEQLKYFCKYNNCFRTGAKNRILYITYLGLCKQLDPTGPFDVR